MPGTRARRTAPTPDRRSHSSLYSEADPHIVGLFDPVAQLVEQRTFNP